jgi:hypothetical protein
MPRLSTSARAAAVVALGAFGLATPRATPAAEMNVDCFLCLAVPWGFECNSTWARQKCLQYCANMAGTCLPSYGYCEYLGQPPYGYRYQLVYCGLT